MVLAGVYHSRYVLLVLVTIIHTNKIQILVFFNLKCQEFIGNRCTPFLIMFPSCVTGYS